MACFQFTSQCAFNDHSTYLTCKKSCQCFCRTSTLMPLIFVFVAVCFTLFCIRYVDFMLQLKTKCQHVPSAKKSCHVTYIEHNCTQVQYIVLGCEIKYWASFVSTILFITLYDTLKCTSQQWVFVWEHAFCSSTLFSCLQYTVLLIVGETPSHLVWHVSLIPLTRCHHDCHED